jgi:hypothetical protein
VPKDDVLHVPDSTTFVANIDLASETAYSPPESCPEMDGIATVEAAIDRLVALLPRLYHVSGDGLEAPVGATVELRAGIANRCGVGNPQVRFERLQQGVWSTLATVGPDPDGIAPCAYEVTDETRQFLRALLLAPGDPIIARTLVQFRDTAEFDTDGLFDPGSDLTSLRATRRGPISQWARSRGTRRAGTATGAPRSCVA